MRFGIFLSLFLIGCANSTDKCGDKFLLLWPDAAGKYSFQEVQITSLMNPYELRGAAAEVYYEAGVTDSGFGGQVARPRLTQSGSVCVPQDIGSSISLTAYAVMERLWNFERGLGVAAQISWPRRVGVEIHMRGDSTGTHNNAHYYGLQDVVTVVPYSRDGLPVSLNHGILAHEQFHAHFQSQVINKLNHAAPIIISSEELLTPRPLGFKPTHLEDAELRSKRQINNFIVRGWNEGLADFYAGVYTGRPDSFMESMPSESERSLDLELTPIPTSTDFMLKAAAWYSSEDEYNRKMTAYAYGQGAQIARLFYRIAHAGILPPAQFLRRVMDNLKDVPDSIVPGYGKTVMESDIVVPLLLKGVELNSTACRVLAKAVQKNTMEKGLPQCSP